MTQTIKRLGFYLIVSVLLNFGSTIREQSIHADWLSYSFGLVAFTLVWMFALELYARYGRIFAVTQQ